MQTCNTKDLDFFFFLQYNVLKNTVVNIGYLGFWSSASGYAMNNASFRHVQYVNLWIWVCVGCRHSGMHARNASVRVHDLHARKEASPEVQHMMMTDSVPSFIERISTSTFTSSLVVFIGSAEDCSWHRWLVYSKSTALNCRGWWSWVGGWGVKQNAQGKKLVS